MGIYCFSLLAAGLASSRRRNVCYWATPTHSHFKQQRRTRFDIINEQTNDEIYIFFSFILFIFSSTPPV